MKAVVAVPTLAQLAAKHAERTRAESGDGAAVYVCILRGGESASSLSAGGTSIGVDSLIGAIVQLLGNLRGQVLAKAAEQDVETARAAAAATTAKPTGEN